MTERIDVRVVRMRGPDGRELTPEEEQAVRARAGSAINAIFCESELAQQLLGPLIQSWCKKGEPVPDDLAEIMQEVRDLWGLMVVNVDRDQQAARLAKLERLIRAGFDRRREGGD